MRDLLKPNVVHQFATVIHWMHVVYKIWRAVEAIQTFLG